MLKIKITNCLSVGKFDGTRTKSSDPSGLMQTGKPVKKKREQN